MQRLFYVDDADAFANVRPMSAGEVEYLHPVKPGYSKVRLRSGYTRTVANQHLLIVKAGA